MGEKRYFRYNGPETHTRGEYGEIVRGGHSNGNMICVFDSAYGDQEWVSIDAGLASGEWFEISEAEYRVL